MDIPSNFPSAQDAPEEDTTASSPTSPKIDQAKAREEARDILAKADKNQAEDGPNTRRAAIRAYKYLYAMVNQHGPLIQQTYEAAKEHATRSKGTATKDPTAYRPRPQELPTVPPELTSELMHCLSPLPDPWPLAKITINMDSPSQWVSKMGRLFFADAYVRHAVETSSHKQQPQQHTALKAVQNVLADLETRVIEFISEWLVTLLMPAKHVLETRSPHLSFMLLKEYWFRELYLGLKVAASVDRNESYTKTIDGQIRCITAEFKPKGANVAWNVNYINVFIPAWMVPPMYHSLRRETIKVADSQSAMGVKSLRPTWFEDETVARAAAEGSATPREPMHGLRLIIKEDALPLREQPKFEALTEVARRGLLAAETWQSNRPHISLKTTIDVPLLGTVIEQNGDGLLEDSLMPVVWPLHLDGAVKQRCVHRTTTLQELDDLLSAYDMKRDLVEINYKAAQWSHRAVWNQWYMEPKRGYNLGQLWADHATDRIKKVTSSREVTLDDIQRVAAVAASKPTAA